MYNEISAKNRYVIGQLMIDKHYQAKGFGEATLKELLGLLKRENKYPVVALCCHIDNIAAIGLYHKFGFEDLVTNEKEVIMELYLDDYEN